MKPRYSKFNARKTPCWTGCVTKAGTTRKHDSKKEAKRCAVLSAQAHFGLISGYSSQPSYPLVVNDVPVAIYRADFRYGDIVEDVKGVKTDVYAIKRKLMLAIHGIEILET